MKREDQNPDEMDFYEIGEDLMEYAEHRERSARGRISELFPYIYLASKRLSTRAISEFLSSDYNVKLSAVSISKALKNADKHWRGFVESIEPMASIFARAHESSVYDVLTDGNYFSHLRDESPNVSGEAGYREYEESLHFLKRRWWAFDDDVRDNCQIHITDDRNMKDEPPTELENEISGEK